MEPVERTESIKVSMTEKGQYCLPLALALHEELPEIPTWRCLEIAGKLWEKFKEWPDTIDT